MVRTPTGAEEFLFWKPSIPAPALTQPICDQSQGKAGPSGCLPLTHISAEVNNERRYTYTLLNVFMSSTGVTLPFCLLLCGLSATFCVVLPYMLHCITLHVTLCCTVLPYLLHCYTVLPCMLHCVTLYYPTCCTVALYYPTCYTVLPYVLLCFKEKPLFSLLPVISTLYAEPPSGDMGFFGIGVA